MNTSSTTRLADNDFSERDERILRELIHTLRAIRYGSVVLTVHNGQVMEIQKTEKIRVTDS